MFPFIILGKLYAHFNPLKDTFDVFFFFPTYAIGGAERVNAEITKAFPDKKMIIFFTRKSPNDGMKHFFLGQNIVIKDISRWTDNKFYYWNNLIYRGICAYYINKQKGIVPKLFIGQCNFGYKLTPYLNKDILVTELIHMFDDKFTWVWAPFVKFVHHRVVISDVFIKKFTECYHRNKIPLKYIDRFQIIFYKLEYLPSKFTTRQYLEPLKVYYAGRGGSQKRVWIIVEIIKKCRALGLSVQFKLAGPFKNELPISLIEDNTYIGELNGGEEMYNFHKQNDILLMTSAWEGFPIVIMEAMSYGVIPLVPNIDAIPDHITNEGNGLIINEVQNELQMIEEAVSKLKWLTLNKGLLNTISTNAYNYANGNFGGEKFYSNYRNVIGF